MTRAEQFERLADVMRSLSEAMDALASASRALAAAARPFVEILEQETRAEQLTRGSDDQPA